MADKYEKRSLDTDLLILSKFPRSEWASIFVALQQQSEARPSDWRKFDAVEWCQREHAATGKPRDEILAAAEAKFGVSGIDRAWSGQDVRHNRVRRFIESLRAESDT